MQIHAQSEILWNSEFFEKCGSSNFRKIPVIGPLLLNVVKIDWSIQIFWDVEFFINLLWIV